MIGKSTEEREQSPFKILHNYRSTSTRSSQRTKKRQIKKPPKEKIEIPIRKHRKMTQNIEVQNKILEEADLELDIREAFSEVQEVKNDNSEHHKYELWDIPDLDKGIPINLNDSLLDYETPLGLNSYKEEDMFNDEN